MKLEVVVFYNVLNILEKLNETIERLNILDSCDSIEL